MNFNYRKNNCREFLQVYASKVRDVGSVSSAHNEEGIELSGCALDSPDPAFSGCPHQHLWNLRQRAPLLCEQSF